MGHDTNLMPEIQSRGSVRNGRSMILYPYCWLRSRCWWTVDRTEPFFFQSLSRGYHKGKTKLGQLSLGVESQGYSIRWVGDKAVSLILGGHRETSMTELQGDTYGVANPGAMDRVYIVYKAYGCVFGGVTSAFQTSLLKAKVDHYPTNDTP